MQTTGGATELMYACQQCMENEVIDLIGKQPSSVKDRDRTSKTPLHYCAENPNTSCAEIVLRTAPELVNAQDDNGYSPLHLAVIAGNKALIKLLISKGADVNIHDNESHSAVHWAIVSSEKEALEMIVRAGANPSTADIHGGYPLHYAVQMCGSGCDYVKSFEDAIRVVETLLGFGVDVNVKDKDSRQPILWAASAGSPDAVVHLVSSGACVEAADKDGLTALHCAASRGHATTLETLISLCGANVDVIDGNGCSALFYSVTLGHADATELLLQLGAEPNRQDRKGRTPAHCGAAKGQIETLKILQKHGGNLWLRNVKGDIPLHEAVASGRKDLVLWLLSQNSEAINIANNDGRCPLHIASMYNNTEMVKVLLDARSLVNPIMRTSKGVLMTPLNVALCKGHRSCGKYLQLHGGVPFSKVARLEPASAFAVRVSPSDEMMVKSADINNEISPASQNHVSKSRSTVDVQGSQESNKTESGEKRKIYRRRKKKRSASSAPNQDSDSDESVQEVKMKVSGSRKVKKSNGADISVRDNPDESMKTEKVRLITKSSKVEKNSVNISAANSQTDSPREVVEETVTAKKVTKRKTLQTNKSFNETKNVSDLSPEDFPPLMQTINHLDMVMMEPDIEESRVEGGGRSLKAQDAAALGSGHAGVTVEGNDEELRLETVSVEAAPNVRNEKTHEVEIELKEDKIEKTTASSLEESVKTSEIPKAETEIKSAETKIFESKSENGSHRKSVKSPKTSTNSGSGKKEERISKSEKTSSAGSDGSDRHKKAGRPKSPKVAMTSKAKERTSETSTVKSKDSEDKRIVNSDSKIGDDIKESENDKATAKTEAETHDRNDGITLGEETRSDHKYSPEVKAPEGVTITEMANKENDLNSSRGESEKVTVTGIESKDMELDSSKEKNKKLTGTESNDKEMDSSKQKSDEKVAVAGTGKKDSDLDSSKEKSEKVTVTGNGNEDKDLKSLKELSETNETVSGTGIQDNNLDSSKERSEKFTVTGSGNEDKDLESSKEMSERVTVSGTGSKEKVLNHSKEKEKVVGSELDNSTKLEPSGTSTPKEKLGSCPNSENLDVIVTEKEEMHLNLQDEKKMKDSDEIQTSAATFQQSVDSESTGNAEAHNSEVFPSETLLALKTSGKSSPNDVELLVGKSTDGTNEAEPQNVTKQDSVLREVSNAKSEESRVTSVEQMQDVGQEDEIAKEKGEVNEVRNEGNVPEGGEFHNVSFSRKNDFEQKPPKVTRVSRLCRRQRDFKGNMNDVSVTQLVQNTLRKYHMERGIFYQLLELKRYQIRSGRANEQVLVKRLADEYERSRVFLGMKPFSGLYKFREFEKFLYDQLKALNARRSFLIPEIKSYDDIDAISGFLKKSRYKIINEIPQPEMVCTCITQRCHHSACAYTSIPCSGYITDLRRLRCHRPGKEGLFPRIEQPSSFRSDTKKTSSRPATLELIQGSEKHVVTLPQNSPGKGKRYYVTFTIKSAPAFKEEEESVGDSKSPMKHRHAKSV